MASAQLEIRRAEGTEFVPLDDERLTLGRSPGSSVSFPSEASVSRSHAVLERDGAGWLVRDAGSSNGTFVNGAKVAGERALEPGDEIQLGEVLMTFRLDEEATATHAAAAPAPGGYLDLGEEWRAPSVQPDDTSGRAQTNRPGPSPTPVAPDADTVQRGRGQVRGIARGVQVRRTGEQDRDILTFRVDRYDASGNRLPSVGVEFRDYEGGHVGEGEEVEASGRWSRGTLRADRVSNLSTRAEVHGAGPWKTIVAVIAVLIILAFIAYIAISGMTDSGVENPFE